MRYFIYFSYDGRRYHGWQVQPNAQTVQGVLDAALSTLLREDVHTTGAGRTDTGVSARRMVAHFDTEALFDPAVLTRRLNALLPPDIAARRLRSVPQGAHARFDALARTYHYYIYKEKEPFRRTFAARVGYDLDFRAMNAAADTLLRVDDFTSFAKRHSDVKTHRCHVSRAAWEMVAPGLWRFEITADRFLRGMVRAIVGTLLDVGRGRLSADDFRAVVDSRDRCAAADAVPPHALFLVDIKYDEARLNADPDAAPSAAPAH